MSLGSTFDDVLAAAQAGAPWALQRLYQDLAPVVTGYLRLHGAAEPDDTASEAFLHVFRGLHGFDGDEAALRSWVFTIVHRRLIDERRRRGRQVSTVPLDDLPAVPGGDVEHEALEAIAPAWVHDALDVLSDDQRAVVLLRLVADLSVEEVATIVGKRPGAVRGLQHRGLERLRRHLATQRVTERPGET